MIVGVPPVNSINVRASNNYLGFKKKSNVATNNYYDKSSLKKGNDVATHNYLELKKMK